MFYTADKNLKYVTNNLNKLIDNKPKTKGSG